IFSGKVADGMELQIADGRMDKVSGIYRLLRKDQARINEAAEGETVALGKLEHALTGDTLGPVKGTVLALAELRPPHSVFSLALRPTERKDEVKLSSALQKLGEEDPSLKLEFVQDSGETILSGQGEMHLR